MLNIKNNSFIKSFKNFTKSLLITSLVVAIAGSNVSISLASSIAPTYPCISQNLSRGDGPSNGKLADVILLQKRMFDVKMLGNHLTGYYGPITSEVVQRYQSFLIQNGEDRVTANGVLDTATRNILNTNCSADLGLDYYDMDTSAPSSSCRLLNGELYIGDGDSSDRNSDETQSVLKLQNYLMGQGFWTSIQPPTGFYGKVTSSAVKKYQSKNGLSITGNVDTNTLSSINTCATTNTNSPVKIDKVITPLPYTPAPTTTAVTAPPTVPLYVCNGIISHISCDVSGSGSTNLVAYNITPNNASSSKIQYYSATVENRSSVAAKPFVARFEYVQKSDMNTSYRGSDRSVGYIAPNGTTMVTDAISIGYPGNYYIRLCVDINKVIAETNENDNCSAWTSLTVADSGVSSPFPTPYLLDPNNVQPVVEPCILGGINRCTSVNAY